MDVAFDPAKNAINLQKPGISLQRAAAIDLDTAVYFVDDASDPNELRLKAIAFLDGKLFALVFIETATGLRAISLRKASNQEHKDYEEAT